MALTLIILECVHILVSPTSPHPQQRPQIRVQLSVFIVLVDIIHHTEQDCNPLVLGQSASHLVIALITLGPLRDDLVDARLFAFWMDGEADDELFDAHVLPLDPLFEIIRVRDVRRVVHQGVLVFVALADLDLLDDLELNVLAELHLVESHVWEEARLILLNLLRHALHILSRFLGALADAEFREEALRHTSTHLRVCLVNFELQLH